MWPRRAFLVLCLGAAAARAQSPDEEIARAHFATGVSYYDSDRFASAVKEFREAYRLSRKPVLLYNIARAYERLNDAGRASFYYKGYLSAMPRASERSEVELALMRLRPRVAVLTVRTTMVGAEVLIDGEVIGNSPIEPQLLTEGSHHVEVRIVNRVPAEVDVVLRGGQSSEVRAEPTSAVGVGSNPIPPPIDRAEQHPLAPSIAPPPVEEHVNRASGRPRWLWPVVGIGAGVIAAVVVVLALTLGGTDFNAQARASCMTADCHLYDGYPK